VRFRRTQIFDGLGMRKPISIDSSLRRGPRRDRAKPPVPSTKIEFELELSEFGSDWAIAVQRSRELASGPASIDGVKLMSLHVAKIEVTFDGNDASNAYRSGTAQFIGTFAEAFPFPFVPGRISPARTGDVEFFDALEAASLNAGPIHVDEIEELESYWVFPVHSIGNTGVFVDRRTGRVVEMGSPLPATMWIWGYERGLLEDSPCDLVIEQVKDLARAITPLKRFARIGAHDLDALPLVLEGCASWQAVLHLFEAGDAITWRVQRPAKATL
jgi:hypothetical protein